MMSLIFLISQAQAGGLGITTQNGFTKTKPIITVLTENKVSTHK